jgi:sporulation protein YlmC with PRC-barrel domain
VRTLSSLLRRRVVTESGRDLGRCHDLRAELTARKVEVTELCVGRGGLAERFGVRSHDRHDHVPWSAIVRIEGDRIVVADDAAR